MSKNKSHMKSNAAMGAVLVALSGAVPVPFISTANAATAKISVTGSLVTGITLTAGVDAKFGKVAPTLPNGSAVLSTAGVVTPSNGVTAGGAPQNGTIAFTAVDTTPNVDITIAGMGSMALAATTGGAAATGTAKLSQVKLGAIGAAAAALSTGGGTTATSAGYAITTTSAVMKVGATVTWGAVQALGSFAEEITVTIAY